MPALYSLSECWTGGQCLRSGIYCREPDPLYLLPKEESGPAHDGQLSFSSLTADSDHWLHIGRIDAIRRRKVNVEHVCNSVLAFFP